ncbi:MAG TPA: ACP S-malonyltransferase [Kofleriaceae bacterium]|nr:ACP S-malonyltransferase [Kofleriaceae bacterium]
MKVFMFPGQGAQAIGMGADLFSAYPELTRRADEILGYSIRTLCVEDPRQQLGLTQFTQPALYIVNALTFLRRRDLDGAPALVLGHSLGEYNALHAAGCISFETGLTLVAQRGALMGEASGGGMAAISGLDEAQVQRVLDSEGAIDLDIANLNSPSQIVIAGPRERIAQLRASFERAGARKYVVLHVSAAFHSRYMRPAMAAYRRFAEGHRFATPAVPVIANLTARPYRDEAIVDTLCAQIASPVRWCDSIRYALARGGADFVECGPGIVLTGLYAHIRRNAAPLVLEAEIAPRPDPGLAPRSIPAPAPVAMAPRATGATAPASGLSAATLGSAAFREAYRVRYAYAAASLGHGVSSPELVIRLGNAGLLGYLGTQGLTVEAVETAIRQIQGGLSGGKSYGVSLSPDLEGHRVEDALVNRYLALGVPHVEATSYLQITPALVRFRVQGARRDAKGRAIAARCVLARVAHAEVARAFMSPAPEAILYQLRDQGRLTADEAALARELPLSDDLCAHADTIAGTEPVAGALLLPTMRRLRDQVMADHRYPTPIRVGLSGEIGAPEAAAAAFLLGADFVVTDTINQCTVEAATSERAKDLLQAAGIYDTAYAPELHLFEMGARVRVLKRGALFAARATRLHDLYRHHGSLEELDPRTRESVEARYFKRSLDEVWSGARAGLPADESAAVEHDPRRRMAAVFRQYLRRGAELARTGHPDQTDYLIACGPAMGAFNQWVHGTPLEDWRHRHVDDIATRLMEATAALLSERLQALAA